MRVTTAHDGSVQRGVGLSVAASVEAVAGEGAGRGWDRVGAAQGGERGFAVESVGVVAGRERERCCGVGSHAGQLQERRRGAAVRVAGCLRSCRASVCRVRGGRASIGWCGDQDGLELVDGLGPGLDGGVAGEFEHPDDLDLVVAGLGGGGGGAGEDGPGGRFGVDGSDLPLRCLVARSGRLTSMTWIPW